MKNGFKQDITVNSTTGETKIIGYCIDVFDGVMENLGGYLGQGE
jgi:hypothetical protein